MTEPDSDNYYLILGVTQSASKSDIRQAYRQAASHYYPTQDCASSTQLAMFERLTKAYRTLVCQKTRAEYDAHLALSVRGWKERGDDPLQLKVSTFEAQSLGNGDVCMAFGKFGVIASTHDRCPPTEVQADACDASRQKVTMPCTEIPQRYYLADGPRHLGRCILGFAAGLLSVFTDSRSRRTM